MDFDTALVAATLVRRYKRFLADVVLESGASITVHTPNTGRMTQCADTGSRVWLSESDRPSRKYRHTWELATAGDVLVGVHTGRANRLAEEALRAGAVTELAGADRVLREVRFGERSRLDLRLEWDAPPRRCWVEVKNVTLVRDDAALFPDAVTARGAKHMGELARAVEGGDRAAVVFVVQRMDATRMRPADSIDPAYGDALRRAAAAGVEVYALQFRPSPEAIVFHEQIPVEL